MEQFTLLKYPQFFGVERAYERYSMQDWKIQWKMIQSTIYAFSGIQFFRVLWKWVTGEMRPLGFFRQFFYILHLLSMPNYVMAKNQEFIVNDFSALVLNSIIMWWTYPVFFVYQFLRKRSLDYDFDDMDERGKVYNVK